MRRVNSNRFTQLIFLLFLLQVLILRNGEAQHLEAGGIIGVSNYRGDLSNNSVSLYLKETKGSFGAFASYHFNDLAALRLGKDPGPHGRYALGIGIQHAPALGPQRGKHDRYRRKFLRSAASRCRIPPLGLCDTDQHAHP